MKIETFSFTKYGSLPGKVLHVFSDAIQQDARQPASPNETFSQLASRAGIPRGRLWKWRALRCRWKEGCEFNAWNGGND